MNLFHVKQIGAAFVAYDGRPATPAVDVATAARALLVALHSHFPGEPFVAREVAALEDALAKAAP